MTVLYDGYQSEVRSHAGQARFSKALASHGPLRCAVLAIGLDVVMIAIASMVAAAVYAYATASSVETLRPLETATILAGFYVALGVARGSYALHRLTRVKISRVVSQWAVAIVMLVSAAFLLKAGASYSRLTMAMTAGFGVVSLLGARAILARVLGVAIERGYLAATRTLVLGSVPASSHDIRADLALSPEVRIVDVVNIEDIGIDKAVDHARWLSQTGAVDEIIIALDWLRSDEIKAIAERLRQQALPVTLRPTTASLSSIGYTDLATPPVILLKRAALSHSERLAKRALDIVVSLAALSVLWPVLLVTAAVIKYDSKGPVFFRQRRNGFNNSEFHVIKFRTMRVTEDGPVIRQAQRSDPRITKVGAFLRRTSIDELPQLFNVLRGEMSIVGPRPHALAHNEEWARLVKGYARRHNILPGMTGLAQVAGFRGEATTPSAIEDRVRMDLRYIETWSIALDIRIMIRTAAVLFFQREAY